MQATEEAFWTELEWKSGYGGGSIEYADPSLTCQVLKELQGVLIRNTEEKMRLRKEEGTQGCRGFEERERGRSREDTAMAGDGGLRDG